jgi:hypothetical protein
MKEIIYRPPALKSIVGSYQRRLRNREGWAAEVYVGQLGGDGSYPGVILWSEGGLILDLYKEIIRRQDRNPEHAFMLVEDICNTTQNEFKRVIPKILREKGVI